jgi:hypothetical protein
MFWDFLQKKLVVGWPVPASHRRLWRAPTAIAMGVDQNDGALGVGRYGTPYIDCCANTPSHSFNPMFPHQWCH